MKNGVVCLYFWGRTFRKMSSVLRKCNEEDDRYLIVFSRTGGFDISMALPAKCLARLCPCEFKIKAITRTRPRQCREFASRGSFNSGDSTIPVLIVGAGPVGLVLSLLLTKLGVRCSIVEKCKAFSSHPQAHFINTRSMEVFRKLDGLSEDILRSQPPIDMWRRFIYCTSLMGPILGSVDHMQPQDLENHISPATVAHFSQHKLVGLLLKKLQDNGFRVCKSDDLEALNVMPLVGKELLMGHECVSVNVADESITVTTTHLLNGKSSERSLCCKILVAADGSRSTIRKLMGIELRGEKDIQKLVSVHFFSRDLGQYLLHERPAMLFFVYNTEAVGVIVAHDLMRGEFVLQLAFYPPQQSVEDFCPRTCKKLIFKLVGRELSDINVIDIKPWVMHAEVAEKFVTSNNRIMLVGDAAHRFPPAGGFGMNTGIQDAHNLAWKIACFMEGISPSSILQTYEVERRPIAILNAELGIKNFKAAMAVPVALGIDPAIANSVHRVMNEGLGSLLPFTVQRLLLDGIFEIGRSQLSRFVLNETNMIGSWRLAKLRRIFEEGKSLQLQFPAEDLGFRYLKGALSPDTSTSSTQVPECPTGRRRDYVPSVDPGSRLPHLYIRMLQDIPSNVGRCSTLDLVAEGRVEFLLIIAPNSKAYLLAHAALQVAKEFRVPLKVCVLWPSTRLNGVGPESRSGAALAPWKSFIDVQQAAGPTRLVSWWSMCQMTPEGAILVRPDEHVAWRSKSLAHVDLDLVLEMRRAFSCVLAAKL